MGWGLFFRFLPFWEVVGGVVFFFFFFVWRWAWAWIPLCMFWGGSNPVKYSSADAERCKLLFWVRIFCCFFFLYLWWSLVYTG